MSTDAQTATAVPEQLAPWIKFPPFPVPPAGVHIIPFKDFKPKGIPVKFEADSPESGEVELDAEGIPTVALRVKHELTEAEQSRRKRKRKTAPVVNVNGEMRRQLWFEEWEEGEMFRKTSAINPSTSRVDRFHQAAQEFKSTRPWPPTSNGVLGLWDAFRLYVGIISSIQPPPSKKRLAQAQRAFDNIENEEDEDADEGKFDDKEVLIMDVDEAIAKRRLAEEAAAEDGRNNLTDEAKARIEKRRNMKEARMDFFLNDPEMAMRIFFSAHFRDRGLMWDRMRCRDGPILVEFFLKFVIRNRVLPESEKQLKKTLEVVETARKELPLTYVISGVLPDDLHKRFEGTFTSMAQRATPWPEETQENRERFEEENAKIQEEVRQREVEAREEEKKRFAEFVSSTVGSDIQMIDPDDPRLNLAEETQKDAITDNVDQNGLEVEPASGWGDPNMPNLWASSGADNTTANDDASKKGPVKPQPNLIELMGPTVLVHTHTTGIIETSTRQILKVVRPPGLPQGPSKKKARQEKPAVELVEGDLEQRFAYMVLAPWKKVGNHDKSDIVPPKFLPDSRGAVVEIKKQGTSAEEDNVGEDAGTGPAPFDATQDHIHVLLTPSAADCVANCVGMGLCGTWIQLARRNRAAELEDEDASGENESGTLRKDRKLGGTGVNGDQTKWWYLEELTATFASFHADRQYDDQD